MKTIHLIPNAHLDQVWLWDWREGYNEAIATAQTMLELMDRYPQVTFARGEANFYEPIKKYRPDLMERIRAYVALGRWELVGGNYVQSDQNYPETATFIQQYRRGRMFFKEEFGVDVDVAWAADCAGHGRGLPDILSYAGFKYMGFTRPPEFVMPLPNHSFRWRGLGGGEIICARGAEGYQNERGNMRDLIRKFLDDQGNLPQDNLFLPMGLGDHGGGPSARHIEDAMDFAAGCHEAIIQFSTFGQLFQALEKEKAKLPVVDDELNFFFRGVYFNNAVIKHTFRDVEATVQRAKNTCAVVNRALNAEPQNFSAEIDGLLFNTFHDILPGDSIDRVNQEQVRWMNSVRHASEAKEYDALARLGAALDMQVPPPETPDAPTAVPFLAFNPSPFDFNGFVELESTLDYRPIWEHWGHPENVTMDIRDEEGHLIQGQPIDTEHCFMRTLPWRKRQLIHLDIPAFGYRRLTAGIAKTGSHPEKVSVENPSNPVCILNGQSMTNGIVACRIDYERLYLECGGKSLTGGHGIGFATFADRFGSWGSMSEEPESVFCPQKLCDWHLVKTAVLECGPLRGRLLAVFAGGNSQLDLILSLSAGADAVDIQGTLVWNERDARLRMCFDAVPAVTCQVPGGFLTRSSLGDMPCGRWFKTRSFGFASDHFSSLCLTENAFYVNIVRGAVACIDDDNGGTKLPDRIPVDAGRHAFHCVFTFKPNEAPDWARKIEFPPIVMQHWAHAGRKEVPVGVLLPDAHLALLDITHTSEGGLSLTVQNTSPDSLTVAWNGSQVVFTPWQISVLQVVG